MGSMGITASQDGGPAQGESDGDSDAQPRRAQILLVDDHPVYRLGLKSLISDQPGMHVGAEAANAHDALRFLHERDFDCAVVDVVLRGKIGGLELVRLIRQRAPELPILVIAMHEEHVYAERALGLGANGYAMKTHDPARLITALRQVMAGEIAVSDEMTQRLLRRRLPTQRRTKPTEGMGALSNRELEVYALIGAGKSTRRISEELHVSVKTVESHRARIRDKLGLEDSSQLVRSASLWVAAGGSTQQD